MYIYIHEFAVILGLASAIYQIGTRVKFAFIMGLHPEFTEIGTGPNMSVSTIYTHAYTKYGRIETGSIFSSARSLKLNSVKLGSKVI